MATVKYATKEVPRENKGGKSKEAIIQYGIRTPKSDFDRRVNGDQGPVSYIGPSKTQDRSSAIKGGNSQSKKHVSSGKGQ